MFGLPLASTDFLQFLEIVIWPLVVVVGVYALLSDAGRKVLKDLLASVKKLKAFGVELEFGSDENARRVKRGLEEEFRGYREEVISEFDRQVKQHDVDRMLAKVVEKVVEPAIDRTGDKPYRCTVYVDDIVFKRVLYRLLDYYPGGNGKGSTYSSRFGIIGRSWRLGESQPPTEVKEKREDLINTWGMTREEAASQQSAKWYATYLLGDGVEKPATGLLYIESDGEIDAAKLAKLDSAQSVKTLTEGVEKVMENMRGRGPYLEFLSG